MLKQEVVAQINDDITANGTGAITGTTLNTVLQRIVDIVPEQVFRFPKGSSLNESHIGLLTMNENGYSVVANPSGAFDGVKGKWRIEPLGGATPYVPYSPPSPRQIMVYFNNEMLPSDGDTFVLELSSGSSLTFIFTNTKDATGGINVSVGATAGETIGNLVSAINMNPSSMGQGVSAYYNSWGYYYYGGNNSFTITDSSPTEGLNLNVSYSTSFFTGSSVQQYGYQGNGYYNYGGNNYLYNGFLWLNLRQNGNYINAYLNYDAVFSSGAPSGIIYGNNKFPQNKSEFANNIIWALNNLNIYTPNGVQSFNVFFNVNRVGDVIYVEQKFVTDYIDFGVSNIYEAPVYTNLDVVPVSARKAFLRNVVLGVLVGLDGNVALIDRSEVVKVKLHKNVRFQQPSEDPIGFQANLFYRLLKPVEGGLVEPIYPDATRNDIVDEISTDQSHGGYYNNGNSDFNFLTVNSTILYETLQEGNAGDIVFARRFSFLVPNNTYFGLYDYNYDYGYGYGYK